MQEQEMSRGDVLSSAYFLRGKELSVEDCYSEFASSFNGRLHFHDFYELSVIYEGSSQFMVNGAVFSLGAGSIHLARPSDYHRQMTRRGEYIRYFNLQFSAELLPLELIQAIEASPQPLCVSVPQKQWDNLLKLTREIYNAYAQKSEDPLTQLFIRCNTENLCLYLMRNGIPMVHSRSETMQEPVRRALSLVHRQYRRELRLSEVAAAVGLSPSYFSALFHETVGETFSSYLTGCRLQAACRYLRSGELSVKQVAAICGFGSYAHFVTVFRGQYGAPPKKWRAMQEEAPIPPE